MKSDGTEASTHLGEIDEHASIDPAVERSYVRKMDLILLPLLSIMYFCRFMTGGNIGNAKTGGLDQDLGLHGEQYSLMITLTNVPFAVLEPFVTVLVKRIGGNYVIPFLILTSGIISLCQTAVKDYAGIMTCRLLLACVQSGFFSGVVFYMTLFYKRNEMGFRLAVFYASATIAGAFTGLISYSVFGLESKLAGWQILFLIEGAINFVFGVIGTFIIPRTPMTCWWLTPEERAVARLRLMRDSTKVVDAKFELGPAMKALLEPKMWPFMVLCIAYGVATTSTGTFLPQIVARLGNSTVNTNLLLVAPNLTGCVVTLVVAWLSDYYQERGAFLCLALSLTMIGYIMTGALDPLTQTGASYAGAFFLSSGTYLPSCLIHSWHNNIKVDENSRALITGVMVAFSSVGGIVSAQLFREEWAPLYLQAMGGTAGFQGLAIMISAGLGIYFRRQNAKRDKAYGQKLRAQDTPQSDLVDGERDPRFRYWT
ncbi:major facilitator superfamily domain-containing protein [Aspergillus californicus]